MVVLDCTDTVMVLPVSVLTNTDPSQRSGAGASPRETTKGRALLVAGNLPLGSSSTILPPRDACEKAQGAEEALFKRAFRLPKSLHSEGSLKQDTVVDKA